MRTLIRMRRTPRDFTPKAGTFPIASSYLGKKDTCGGSFIFRTKNEIRGSFSHETTGQITFESFSESVKGKFSMHVKDSDGETIEISGSFEVARGSAFQ